MSCTRALAAMAAAAALAACAEQPTPAPVVDAERAFAQDGYDLGFKRSFLEHSADDAIVLSPDPVNAHESLSQAPDGSPDDPKLEWWPLWAGISLSGDLGFTTGPYRYDGELQGHYFTVWKKQADGVWKWVFDAGVGADPSAEDPQGSPAGFLPLAAEGSPSPQTAAEEVRLAEATLAEEAQSDLATAYARWLAADARIHSDGPPPAKSVAEHESALAVRGDAMTFAWLGGGASDAGDLVWTYGDARWSADGADARGHYARVWQKRKDGWRIVFDELVPRRAPAGE